MIWADGDRERPFEDYPPWSTVLEIQAGGFTWRDPGAHHGHYTATWLTGQDREATRAGLDIKPEDF